MQKELFLGREAPLNQELVRWKKSTNNLTLAKHCNYYAFLKYPAYFSRWDDGVMYFQNGSAVA